MIDKDFCTNQGTVLLDKMLEMLYSDLMPIFDFLFRKITIILFSSFIIDFEVKEARISNFRRFFKEQM